MATTIHDVANYLGVSVSTVSRCLNHHPDVSPEMQARVEAAFEKLDFVPSSAARNVSKKSARTIGLTIPDIEDSYFARSASGAEEIANREGYTMFYGSLARSPERMLRFVRNAREMRFDGIIITPDGWSDELLEVIKKSGIPAVALRRRPPAESGIPYVDADYYTGAEIMVDYLYKAGHRNIAHVVLDTAVGRERFRGYTDAMKARGLKPMPVQVDLPATRSVDGVKNGFAAAKLIREQYPQATAIFASTDPMAIGVKQYLQSVGLDCPRDISLCGTGDTEYADLPCFALTTLAVDRYALGRCAAQLLFGMIKGTEPAPESVLLETQLIIRDSVSTVNREK